MERAEAEAVGMVRRNTTKEARLNNTKKRINVNDGQIKDQSRKRQTRKNGSMIDWV